MDLDPYCRRTGAVGRSGVFPGVLVARNGAQNGVSARDGVDRPVGDYLQRRQRRAAFIEQADQVWLAGIGRHAVRDGQVYRRALSDRRHQRENL